MVDKDGVLVSEFQLRESDLADPAAFVTALQQSIEACRRRRALMDSDPSRLRNFTVSAVRLPSERAEMPVFASFLR